MSFQKMVASGMTLVAFLLILFGGASTSEAAPLKVAYSAFTSTYLPLWIAEEKGFFKSEGLDIEINYGRGGSSTSQALLAKSIDIAVIGGGPIEANLSGGDLVYIAAHVPTLVFSMFSGKGINSVKELKGGKIGSTAAASASEYAAILTLKRYGLDPQKDVKFVYSGGMDNSFASLSQGLIEAAVFSGPIIIQARKSGFKEIVDVASLRIPFIHEGVAVRRDFIREHRETVKRFMRGFVLGIRSSKVEKALAYKMIEKYLKLKEPDVVEEAYKEIAGYFALEPFVSNEAVQNMLSVIGDRLPPAKSAQPDRFYDNSILTDLKNEGFFK